MAAFSRKVRQGAARDIVRRCAVGALYRTPRGRRLRLSGRRGASLHARRLTGAPRGAPPPAQPPRVWSDPTICSASGFDLPATHRNVSARWQVACERAATRRGVPNALRGVSRSAAPCGGRRTHEGAAGRANTRRKALPAEPHELTPKAAGPRGAPAAQCRPPRVARSRGTPQRGRRAGDFVARNNPLEPRIAARPERAGGCPRSSLLHLRAPTGGQTARHRTVFGTMRAGCAARGALTPRDKGTR